MLSGIMFGYTGLVEGIVSHIEKELGEKATVVATAALARSSLQRPISSKL